MTDILVDSNVILDVVTEDPQWFEWSAQMLTNYAEQGNLVINPFIYAEISIGFNQPEEVEAALPEDFFRRDSLPYAAAFLAGQRFLEYRRR
ncbi:MAG: type II toxin-antitoxin system VapC family toxin, partial [Microcystis aeruginosa]